MHMPLTARWQMRSKIRCTSLNESSYCPERAAPRRRLRSGVRSACNNSTTDRTSICMCCLCTSHCSKFADAFQCVECLPLPLYLTSPGWSELIALSSSTPIPIRTNGDCIFWGPSPRSQNRGVLLQFQPVGTFVRLFNGEQFVSARRQMDK